MVASITGEQCSSESLLQEFSNTIQCGYVACVLGLCTDARAALTIFLLCSKTAGFFLFNSILTKK